MASEISKRPEWPPVLRIVSGPRPEVPCAVLASGRA